MTKEERAKYACNLTCEDCRELHSTLSKWCTEHIGEIPSCHEACYEYLIAGNELPDPSPQEIILKKLEDTISDRCELCINCYPDLYHFCKEKIGTDNCPYSVRKFFQMREEED